MKSYFALLLDVQSASIGASIVHFDGGEKPRIFYTIRKDFGSHGSHSFESHMTEMKKCLSGVVKEIHSHTSIKPVEAIISIGSPWHISQTRTAVMRRATPFLIKKELLHSFKQKEERKCVDEHKEIFGKKASKVVLLESKIANVMVDGYGPIDPIGKKARSFSLTLYMSVCPIQVTEAIEDVVASVIHIKKCTFTTFQFMSFSALRDLSASKRDFLVIDISGEITDITLVRNDVILESISIPLGSLFFKNRIKKHFNWTNSEYHSRLRMSGAGKLHEFSHRELEEYIGFLVNEWGVYIRRAVHELGGKRMVPEMVYMIGPEVIVHYAKRLLEGGEFQHFTETQNPLRVTLVHHSLLYELCSIQNSQAFDPSLVILGHFANRILK